MISRDIIYWDVNVIYPHETLSIIYCYDQLLFMKSSRWYNYIRIRSSSSTACKWKKKRRLNFVSFSRRWILKKKSIHEIAALLIHTCTENTDIGWRYSLFISSFSMVNTLNDIDKLKMKILKMMFKSIDIQIRKTCFYR